jgi:glycosyl transferase, family 25
VVPVVVISLAKSTERRAYMQRNLEDIGIAYTFFYGIDGHAMSPDVIAANAPRLYIGQSDRPLIPGEIGCAASMRAVLADFLNGSNLFVCIAEDDVLFSPDVRHFLDPTMLCALPLFDIMRLHNDSRRGMNLSRIVAWEAGYAVHAPLRLGVYCFAQIFTRAGAKAVISGLVPLRAPIDNLIYRDVGIFGLRVLEVRPAIVTGNHLPSVIGNRFDHSESKPRDLIVTLRRWMYLFSRRVRRVTSYMRAWGACAILQIRAFPNLPPTGPSTPGSASQ